MKPKQITSDIYLDGGSQAETRDIYTRLGFLDGQTTNPTLISRNPEAKRRIDAGERFSKPELLEFYRGVVTDISKVIPEGSISIEVYCDHQTTAEEMVAQGKEFYAWIPNGRVKYPTTARGLEAARQSVAGGMRVNLTLCFSQPQAAAVYAATAGAGPGQVIVSPFIGRLDDQGENGMQLIENIVRTYKDGDGHVQLLTASVRSLDHLREALKLTSDIVTVPEKILLEWADGGLPTGEDFTYDPGDLKPIPYVDLDLSADWKTFDLAHSLTDQGIERFSADWNALMEAPDGARTKEST